jgi:hypothetical protein
LKKKNQKNFSPFADVNAATPPAARRNQMEKRFFASFSLRGAFAVAL